MNNTQKQLTKLLAIPLLGIFTVGYFGYSFHTRHAAYNDMKTAKVTYQEAKMKYEQKKEKVDEQGLKNGVNSDNPVMKYISINNLNNKTINKELNVLFGGVYNWTNPSQFQNRLNSTKKYMSSGMQKNIKYFNKPAIIQQNKAIDADTVNSKLDLVTSGYTPFNNANGTPDIINVIAKVNYSTWVKGSTGENNNTQLFALKYDTAKHQFLDIEQLSSQKKSVNNDN